MFVSKSVILAAATLKYFCSDAEVSSMGPVEVTPRISIKYFRRHSTTQGLTFLQGGDVHAT
ncbi:uncharacterized protein PHALS_00015 [Plasmopara halstedii]|uniref:Uncharacterized protein n=1 Tax=Plasmopara halstedii TaxID=4781 RepID=A0A0P1ARM5_PLAHL|nr:uncharacterized protein PHALS_00015 [Plasmopara halstedii]CEG44253.1 hypothetical protein PHALS_00015 [Plasmopara halstedii]|eukprot:XP_024580622.1 hypothetical protein PHALS_00015 [Plasmopara halstedii]